MHGLAADDAAVAAARKHIAAEKLAGRVSVERGSLGIHPLAVTRLRPSTLDP
ncbi:MAG: hypothetical protein WD066_10130 [Planctomycetaceae bacterium]